MMGIDYYKKSVVHENHAIHFLAMYVLVNFHPNAKGRKQVSKKFLCYRENKIARLNKQLDKGHRWLVMSQGEHQQ